MKAVDRVADRFFRLFYCTAHGEGQWCCLDAGHARDRETRRDLTRENSRRMLTVAMEEEMGELKEVQGDQKPIAGESLAMTLQRTIVLEGQSPEARARELNTFQEEGWRVVNRIDNEVVLERKGQAPTEGRRTLCG